MAGDIYLLHQHATGFAASGGAAYNVSSLERKLSLGAAEGSAGVSSGGARGYSADMKGGAKAMHYFH